MKASLIFFIVGMGIVFAAHADCDKPSNNALQTAIMQNKVIACMTKAEVLRSAGTLQNHRMVMRDGREIWFFPAHNEAFPESITFDTDGNVTDFGDATDPAFQFCERTPCRNIHN